MEFVSSSVVGMIEMRVEIGLQRTRMIFAIYISYTLSWLEDKLEGDRIDGCEGLLSFIQFNRCVFAPPTTT